MKMRFFIVDDEDAKITHLKSLLKAMGYTDNDIRPAGIHPFKNWRKVWPALLKELTSDWMRDADCCIVFFDLALGDKAWDIEAGMKAIRENRENPSFNDFVWIVFSNYMDANQVKNSVDGIIYKSTVFAGATQVQVGKLKLKLGEAQKAWSKRTGRSILPPVQPPRVSVIDSAAGRRLLSDLGAETLEVLGTSIASSWPTMRVQALTGGYSGAYVLRLFNPEGKQQLVAKVATNPQLLRDEVARWAEALSTAAFTGLINPNRGDPYAIDDRVSYLVQASVSGRTLEEEANGGAIDTAGILAPLIELSVEAVRSQMRVEYCPLLTLSSDDQERFGNSVAAMQDLRHACEKRGLLPADFPSADTIRAFTDRVVIKWADCLKNAGMATVPVVPQHGDLNPRNILITTQGQMQLIDFARYGAWPVGYDLARLELQILFRLLGTSEADEYFPDQLVHWTELWKTVEERGPAASNAPHGVLDLLGTTAGARTRLEQELPDSGIEGPRLVALLRCFDALKMVSYQDAPVFKKLLFLYVAVRAAVQAGLLSQ